MCLVKSENNYKLKLSGIDRLRHYINLITQGNEKTWLYTINFKKSDNVNVKIKDSKKNT